MILEELWYGNINPLEDSTDGNAEVKKLLNLVGRNRDKLCETMTEQQRNVRHHRAGGLRICLPSWREDYAGDK